MCSSLVLRDVLFSVCNGFHFDPGMTRIELSSLGVFNLLTLRKRNLVIFEWLFENVGIKEQLHQKKCGRLLVVSWNWYFLAQAAQLRLHSQPGVAMRISSCQWAVSGSGTCAFHLTSSKETYLSRITPLGAFPLEGVQNVNSGSNYLDEEYDGTAREMEPVAPVALRSWVALPDGPAGLWAEREVNFILLKSLSIHMYIYIHAHIQLLIQV